MADSRVFIHPSADVSPQARIGAGSRIWHQAQIREGVVLGENCIVGKGVYIDFGVTVGNNVKIQNGAMLYHGLAIEDGVFVGPQVCLTNDRNPRAITSDGLLKAADDWTVGCTTVRYGASLGAGAIVLPNVVIGRFAMVAAGALVTKNVPDHTLVLGMPARTVGYVCRCGLRLQPSGDSWQCQQCGWVLELKEE